MPVDSPAVRRRLPIIALAAALAGCALLRELEPPHPYAPSATEIDGWRERLRSQFEVRAAALWRRWTGAGALDPVAGAGDAAAHPDRAAVVGWLARQTSDPAVARRLGRLRVHLALAGERAPDHAMRTLDEAADGALAAATVAFGGREIALADLDVALEEEPDGARRRALWASTAPVLERLNPLLEKRLNAVRSGGVGGYRGVRAGG